MQVELAFTSGDDICRAKAGKRITALDFGGAEIVYYLLIPSGSGL